MTDTAAYKQYNLISYILHLLGFPGNNPINRYYYELY